MSPKSFLLLPCFIIISYFLSFVSATVYESHQMPRLSFRKGPNSKYLKAAESTSSAYLKDFKAFYYSQTLDHFIYRPESSTTFNQRYFINSRYWGGANTSSPIFAYLGAEQPITNDIAIAGLVNDNAPDFKALLVYIEHRYYGESFPFGSLENAFNNTNHLGYFTSAQALADYAEGVVSLKKNLSAENSPVIVVGGSYGGMLASWFRLKYPHIAMGALASSAPILYFEDLVPQDTFYVIATNDYKYRYYGDSIPFGSEDEAFQDASTFGYLNSAQALADYAEVILHVKKKFSAERCPFVVIGGSYGGMLAAWFRLKYPHVAVRALASSAPILFFDGIELENGYSGVVSKDFRDTSESCHNTIRDSWSKINEIANLTNGLSILSRNFKTCNLLSTSSELKDFLNIVYSRAAQYNNPHNGIKQICDAIDGAPKSIPLLDRVFAGIEAYARNLSCYPISNASYHDGWEWQTCTEMVMPMGHDRMSTMFEFFPFNLTDFSKDCRKSYGIEPRPHWITTEYGGEDIKLVLAKFGGNIIFSNGLKDPYSCGSVLHNISESIVALATKEGSHCLDIFYPSPDEPEWLVKLRDSEQTLLEVGLQTTTPCTVKYGQLICWW